MMFSALPFQWPTFNISYSHAVVLIIVGAVLVPYFVVTYRAERALLPARGRRALQLLRISLAAAVLLMIARPTLLSTDEEVHTPVLPILVDGSKSMAFP